MFEDVIAEEERRGVKGFIKRHFGPVIHLDLAEQGIREIGLTFMGLAVVSALFSFSRSGIWGLLDGLILAVIAFFVYQTKSRVAAVLLLVVTGLGVIARFPAIFPWVWVAFAARATQLTFGYHRLRKEQKQLEGVF